MKFTGGTRVTKESPVRLEYQYRRVPGDLVWLDTKPSDLIEADKERGPSLQIFEELDRLIDLFREKGVRSYLEVGTRYGGTFENIVASLPVGSKATAVDFPGGAFGDFSSIYPLTATCARLVKAGYDVDCVLGPSAAPEVIKRVAVRGPYNAIFIDADHSYQALWKDLKNYIPMLNKTVYGMVVLHDIVAPYGHVSRTGLKIDVPRVWQELKRFYSADCTVTEIVAPESVMGIGVLQFSDKARLAV